MPHTPKTNSPVARDRRSKWKWRVLFLLSLSSAFAALAAYFKPPNHDTLVRVIGRDGKLGVINGDGRLLTEPILDWIPALNKPCWAQLFWVEKGDHWGAIGPDGAISIHPEWDARPRLVIGQKMWIEKDGQLYWIDKQGRVVDAPEGSKSRILESFPPKTPTIPAFPKFSLTQYPVLIPEPPEESPDDNSSLIISTYIDHDDAPFLKGWEPFPPIIYKQTPILGKEVYWGNFEGKEMFPVPSGLKLPSESYYLRRLDSGGHLVFNGGKHGIVRNDGSVEIDFEWDGIKPFPRNFEYMDNPSSELKVKRSEKWGIIDRQGHVKVEPEWEDVDTFVWSEWDGMYFSDPDSTDVSYEYLKVKRNGRWGLIEIDSDRKQVIAPEWDEIESLDSEFLMVERNGYQGLINKIGEVVVKPEWDKIFTFNIERLAKVERDGKMGWIDRQGRIRIPPVWERRWKHEEYQEIPWQSQRVIRIPLNFGLESHFDSDGYLRLFKGDTMGFFDKEGNQLFTLEGCCGTFDKNGRAWVRRPGGKDDKDVSGWIDKKGNEVISLPGDGWEHSVTPDGVLIGHESSGHYLAVKRTQPNWLQWMLWRIENWIDDRPLPDAFHLCHCYDVQGNLVWSNAWVRFEYRCLMILGVSVFLTAASGWFGWVRKSNGPK